MQSGWNQRGDADRRDGQLASTEPDFAVGLELDALDQLPPKARASTEPDFAVGLERVRKVVDAVFRPASTEPDFAVGLEPPNLATW